MDEVSDYGLHFHSHEQRKNLQKFEKQYGVYSKKFDTDVLFDICERTGLSLIQVHRWFRYQREKYAKARKIVIKNYTLS